MVILNRLMLVGMMTAHTVAIGHLTTHAKRGRRDNGDCSVFNKHDHISILRCRNRSKPRIEKILRDNGNVL